MCRLFSAAKRKHPEKSLGVDCSDVFCHDFIMLKSRLCEVFTNSSNLHLVTAIFRAMTRKLVG